MANWQMKLEIKDFYHKFPDELSIQEVAKLMSERIDEKLPFIKAHFLDYFEEIEEISIQFSDLAEYEDADADDFDYIMEDLYNWADTSLDGKWGGKKLMWIETF